jgi:hypothetical protein
MPQAPKVPVIIGGTEYTICFDINSLCAYEQETGRNLLEENLGETLNVSTSTALVWAGLATHHPNIKLPEFRAKLDTADLPRIVSALHKAWGFAEATMPEPEKLPADFPTSGSLESAAAR